ncbi:hypothetical protein JHW43_008018 [Diplocarpon mali]|nr:hypothetical protein JHW43_008018 [Diplocarpon mali]
MLRPRSWRLERRAESIAAQLLEHRIPRVQELSLEDQLELIGGCLWGQERLLDGDTSIEARYKGTSRRQTSTKPLILSEKYEVSGEQATGHRVRISCGRLRAQYLPDNATCFCVKVTIDGHLAGHAFACRWTANDQNVCWVTQLVVDRRYRERGLAQGLLNQLRQKDMDMSGIMSSHPAACLAAAKTFGSFPGIFQLGLTGKYAEEILHTSPIDYVKGAQLRGSLFDAGDTSGFVSSADSGFFVDHGEPLEALALVRNHMDWPFGKLIEGLEFIITEARRRSRSWSTSGESSGS